MLKKLLKYDLEYIFKFLIIFYSLGLFFALFTRIFLSIDNSLACYVIGKICSGTTISMIFSIFINNLMRLWVRFKTHFYSDEAYLTHTLPISKTVHYLSKIVTAVISVFTSVSVIGLSLFIAYYSKGNINLLKSIILPENLQVMTEGCFYLSRLETIDIPKSTKIIETSVPRD